MIQVTQILNKIEMNQMTAVLSKKFVTEIVNKIEIEHA